MKKRITIRHAGRTHYVCHGVSIRYADGQQYWEPDPDLPADAKRLWRQWGLMSCDGAVLAFRAGHLIGFFRWDRSGYRGLHACGTWVANRYRKAGIAFKLWDAAMAKRKPRRVTVLTLSPGGRALVAAVKAAYPRVQFLPA